jgi:hypothetical protein
VSEDEAGFPSAFSHHEPDPLGLVQGVEQIVLALLGDRRQELERDRPPDGLARGARIRNSHRFVKGQADE